jgi:Cellulose biosynthesis protein BcsS
MSGAGPRAPRLRAAAPLRLAACILIALVAGWPPTDARGESAALEGLAGWEGDSHGQGYGFAGLGWLIPAGPKLVVPLRALGSYLYYDFESSGVTTKVRSPGVTLMSGIRFPGARGSLTLLGGGEARREQRTDDTGTGTSETKTTSGIVLQADGDRAIGDRWRGFLFANYGGATRYLYGRTAIRRQMTNLEWKRPTSFFLGLEAIGQGNDESDAIQGGAFAEWTLVPHHASLAVRGGYKDNWSPGESHRRGGYLGFSLYHRF